MVFTSVELSCQAHGPIANNQNGETNMTRKSTHPQHQSALTQSGRRGFLKGMSLAAAGAAALPNIADAAGAQAPATRPAAPVNTGESKLFATVDTTSGKVQGIISAGIREFKGIPYGASTAGKNRFMPPKKPVPWAGVRECFAHGQCCPQTPSNLRSEYGMMILWDQQ